MNGPERLIAEMGVGIVSKGHNLGVHPLSQISNNEREVKWQGGQKAGW